MVFQVLLITPTEADYWHIRSLLGQMEIFEFDLKWVASFEAIVKTANASGKYDAYIIDSQLREFTAWIEQVAPAPIILLTDTQAGGVAALPTGIADYWVKEQLSVPLLEHSLRLTITHARTKGDVERHRRGDNSQFSILNSQFPIPLQTIVNSTFDGILIIDDSGIVRFANPAAARLFNRPVAELTNHEFGRPMVIGDTAELGIFRSCGELGFGEMSVAETEWDGELVYIVSVRDITERRQAESALRESEERFRQMADSIQEVFWLVVADTRELLYVSPAYGSIWGNSREALYTQSDNWLNTVYSEDRESVIAAFEQQRCGASTTLEYRIFRPDGEIRWICDRAFPIKDERGEVYRIAGVAEDITERKLAEEELRATQQQLQFVLSSSPAIIYTCQTEGDFACTFVSENIKEILGYNPQELLTNPKFWVQRLHSEDAPEILGNLSPLFEQGHHIHEYRFLQQDGTYRWLRDELKLLKDEDGRPLECIGSMIDITSRKLAEEELQATQQRLQYLVSSSPAIIYSCEPVGYYSITFISENVREILGYSPEEILADPLFWIDRMHQEDLVIFANLSPLYDSGHYSNEYRFQHQDGTYFWLRDEVKLIRDETGNPLECIGYLIDISERKRAEEALRQQMQRERLLAQITQDIQRSLNLEEILNTTVTKVRQFLQTDRVIIYRFEADWSGIVTVESVSINWQPILGRRILDACLTVETCIQPYTKGRIQAVDDIYNAGLADCYVGLLTQFQVRANLVVPILQGEQLWGLLVAHHCACPRPWQMFEIELLQQLATKVGIAIQRAEFYRQLEMELAERRQTHQALQQAKETADTANRAKSQFLANMSHELRTPLNAILGFTQLMLRSTAIVPEHRQHLAIVNRSGEHLLSLINDILDLSKIEAGRITLNIESFDLFQLLNSLQDMFQLKAQSKGLQLIFEQTPDVPQYLQTDQQKLRSTLINLIGNAIKFTQEGCVTLRVSRGDREIGRWGDAGMRGRGDAEMGSWRAGEAEGEISNSQFSISKQQITNNQQQTTIHFEVEDTGSGIAPEEIDTLFEAFVQTKTGHKFTEGTGLGLAISQHFVQLMGGNIVVSSTLSSGSIFQFDILCHLSCTVDVPTPQPNRRVIGLEPNQPKYRILVVEDQWTNRQLLVKLLEPLGFEVREAANGQEGVNLWHSWKPHLIFLDMRMPVMDGYETIRQIRAEESERWGDGEIRETFPIPKQRTTNNKQQTTNTIIIALTASAFESQRSFILESGCDDFIAKPWQETVLLEKISFHLRVRYLYNQLEPTSSTKSEAIQQKLISEDLTIMSAEWIRQLHIAGLSARAKQIRELIEQIPKENVALIQALSYMINHLDFEQIVDLTDGEGLGKM